MADTADHKRYGVLIASSTFPDEPKLLDLECPENDVDGLHAVLIDETKGGFADVDVIKNQPSHVVTRRIQQMTRKAGENDLLLIFFAGHGKLDHAGHLYLTTHDTVQEELESTSVATDWLVNLFSKARTNRIVLLLDCCYSGAIDKALGMGRGDVENELQRLGSGYGTFVLTASTDMQTAREEASGGYGVFSRHVIDGLDGEADRDGDGLITTSELYDYVNERVRATSHQEPLQWGIKTGGRLVLSRSGRKPREERKQAIRARLIELAGEGRLPDPIFAKALEILNLPYEATRSGAAAAYDGLLDRVLAEDFSAGTFVYDWQAVTPDDPGVETESGDITAPVHGVKAGLIRPDFEDMKNYDPRTGAVLHAVAPAPMPRKGQDVPSDGQAKSSRSATWKTLTRLCFLALGYPFAVAIAMTFEANKISYFHTGDDAWRSDEQSGVITAMLIWAILCLVFALRTWRKNERDGTVIYAAGALLAMSVTMVMFAESL